MKGREKERRQREKELEKKARQQADQREYISPNSSTASHLLRLCCALNEAFLFVKLLLQSAAERCVFLPVVAVEEQRASLSRELSSLRHTHSKVRRPFQRKTHIEYLFGLCLFRIFTFGLF